MSEVVRPMLLRSAAYLPVRDVAAAADEYVRLFGFVRDYIAGEPAQFAIVSRDDLPLMFRLVAPKDVIVPNEQQGGTWDVFYWVRDVRALYAELVGRGATVAYGPIVQASYQMEEFAVRDGSGYVLGFGQPLEREET